MFDKISDLKLQNSSSHNEPFNEFNKDDYKSFDKLKNDSSYEKTNI